jgi:hypothetical protein
VPVRRWLPVRPVSRRDAEVGDAMHGLAAIGAVKDQPSEFTLEISLHVQ